jgi:energy-coupling factor transport system substrate-specific component
MNAKRIALIAMLSALSVVGRLYFSVMPNIQPTTSIIIISAFMVRPYEAVMIAFLSSVLSNVILGAGMWTIWQVIAWSLIGLISGYIGKFHSKIPLIALSIYAGICGYLYGFLISFPMSQLAGGHFWVYYLAGLPFDTAHAVGNLLFFFILYPILMKVSKKFLKG